MNTTTLEPTVTGPLAPEHRHELTLAANRARKIRNAARVATFNAWITGILAALSAPFALLSLSGLFVTAGLAVVAYNEFRGRNRLLAFNPAGATLLGCNQLCLLAMITAYCLWMLAAGLGGDGALAAQLEASPDLRAALGSLDDLGQFDALYRVVVVAVYGSVIVLSIVFQGLNALYYFTRRKHVEVYVRQTPDWVVDLQRATIPV